MMSQPLRRRSHGMALIAVLWIVSALSIMVMGLVHNLRGEARLAGQSRQIAEAAGLGDAAIHIVLQAMMARTLQGQRQQGLQVVPVAYGGRDIAVEILPLNGLINLNSAGAPLLVQMLVVAGVPQNTAQALAQTIVDARTARDAQGATRNFEATEDLLLVPGVDYALYALIAPLVNADLNTGQVNPLAAPPAVQALLAAAGLQSPPAGGGTDVYRLQARVPLEAGKIQLLTQDVALGAALAHTAPWRILRADRQILSPAA